jgi:Ca-activated chloride channel family protein
MRFAEPQYFYLLFLLPLFAAFYWWAFRKKRQALARFGNLDLVRKLMAATSSGRQVFKAALVVGGLFFLVLAAARPQFGTKEEVVRRRGVDIVVALDTSLSMLAEDIRPNRLERAKQEVGALIDRLKGDRVGIVAFAGQAFVQCPLTLDYGAAKLFLDAVDTGLIPVRGTAVGEAIRVSARAFDREQKKYKVLILVTDGEDHEGDPLRAARQAAEDGVRIYAIGVGTREGELVPVRGEGGDMDYLKDRSGNIVKTRMDETTLEKVALITDGKYYRSTSSGIELDRVYQDISRMEQRELSSRRLTQFEDRYQYPLFLAVACFAAEALLSDRRKVKGEWRGRFE